MNSVQVPPAESGAQTSQAFLKPAPGQAPGRAIVVEASDAPILGPRRVGYGLPCAKCKTYYAADLKACPVCHTCERVSPFDAPTVTNSVPLLSQVLDPAKLEEERERFLREFQAQVPLEIKTTESFHCTRLEHHPDGFEPATVCEGCYQTLQERVDHVEAALHMDLKEATAIIYEAVWADSSDPSKTYSNAAHALLSELRNRAGFRMMLSPLQPLQH